MLIRCDLWIKCIALLAVTETILCVQRFAEAPGYTEVNPGEDALLTCRVSDKRGLCSWQKDNKPVGIYKGKYEWANEDSPTGGDCSLWVRSATLPLDDGQWQCQVTASSYDLQDALSSPPAALAVRVAPQSPRILYNGSHVMPGENITIQAGSRATIVCEARYGNPPASIEWYLESERLSAWSQTNASEVERPRVWAARSVLELGASRASHGRQLSCRAGHPSYPAPHYRQAYTLLDVTFAPVVSIVGADSSLSKLEEGSGVVSLECRAEGNPSPYTWWTRDGQIVNSSGPKLILAPLSRNHSGIYACQARNSLGVSESARVEIDVKYPPRVLWVGPEAALEASLFSRVVLECKAEGNPPPVYRWLHNPGPHAGIVGTSQQEGFVVSSSSQLVLSNVTYKQHGQYACLAINHIGFRERSHKSDPLTLNVLGPPLGVESGSAQGWTGGEATLTVDVCADPPPRKAVWRWGSLRLNVPSQVGRYRAVDAARVGECYRYALVISDAATQDARVYVLHVENERGATAHAVSLTLHQSSHVVPLVAAALVIALLLIIIFCLVRRCRRARDTVQYKTEDLDIEKISALPADAVYSSRDPPRREEWGVVSERDSVAGAGGRYSPGALQAALASLEKEAKDNIYAVLDPQVQYDVTISKHGSVPTHLSLSRPLNDRDSNHWNQPFTTFRTEHQVDTADNIEPFEDIQQIRKSNRSTNRRNNKKKEHVSKTNIDVQYKDFNFNEHHQNMNKNHTHNDFNGAPYRKMSINSNNLRGSQRNEQNSGYIRRYDRQGSNRSGKQPNEFSRNHAENTSQRRGSNRSFKYEQKANKRAFKLDNNSNNCFQNGDFNNVNDVEGLRPNSGMVRALASRFNRNSFDNSRSNTRTRSRPKPLQAFDNQQYLDHVFPAAVEI